MCDGVGTDIVSVPRIAALVRERGDTFVQRWFTPEEIAYCSAKAVPSQHFAARLAAKEAVAKALPFGWDGPVPWRSIEITNLSHGEPVVRLSGELFATAEGAGVAAIRISMSHCDEFATAVAMVTVTRGQPPAGEEAGSGSDAGSQARSDASVPGGVGR
jgi:holo-[acyl-carrier protein] synthase